MADLIDRQEALDCFNDWIDRYGHEHTADEDATYQRITELPAVQPDHTADVSKKVERTDETAQNVSDSDLISRKAVTDALAKFVPYAICDESTESYTNGLTDAYYLILQLPSVQPDLSEYSDKLWKSAYERGKAEIIRCRDCRFNDGTAYCVFHFRDVKGEDYCSWAERRTDG